MKLLALVRRRRRPAGRLSPAISKGFAVWGRLRDGNLFRQLLTFGGIGVLSTLAYIGLYAVLRPFMPATLDNLLAQALTAIANTAANRRLTFGIRGQDKLARDHAAGLLAFGIALALTTIALLALHASGQSGRGIELPVLVLANVVATLVRFILLRAWLFQARHQPNCDVRPFSAEVVRKRG